MYTPSSFKETDPNILFEFVEKYNFGLLFSQHTGSPMVTHLPFLVDPNRGKKGVLSAHFARANKHWKHINDSDELLIVFQGPHTYISPSWYVNRGDVPTWNYATVHIRGTATVIHEEELLHKMATKLTHFHENQTESDWKLSEVSKKEYQAELKAIVGIEIEISQMEGKFKYNQNKPVEDQLKVIKNLDKLGLKEESAIMKNNLPPKE